MLVKLTLDFFDRSQPSSVVSIWHDEKMKPTLFFLRVKKVQNKMERLKKVQKKYLKYQKPFQDQFYVLI